MTATGRTAAQQESLSRAQSGQSLANYAAIFDGFLAMGILESEINPRSNIFTFNAWKALGRTVCKGQHGVKIHTWVNAKGKADESGEGESSGYRFPRMEPSEFRNLFLGARSVSHR